MRSEMRGTRGSPSTPETALVWAAAKEGGMAHVTFIHGIGNKPPEEQLLRQWRTALLDDDGLDLDDLGISSSMVYWADLL